MPDFVPFTPSVEQPQPDEAETFGELDQLFTKLSELMLDRYRHAIRGVHAKSHGLLLGDLVIPSLPPAYAQGLFATPGTHPAVLRFSTNPGDILADSISTPRGVALKILGADGPRADGSPDGETSQDFVMAIGPTFPAKTAKDFLAMQKVIVANANDPEIFKKSVSMGSRAVNAVLGVVGLHSATAAQLGYPSTHPLGESFFSQVPVRFGNYIAKIAVRPKSENLKKLVGTEITSIFHYSALRDAIVEFFKTESAEWEVCAQLCADLAAMPVEDPTVEWDEMKSPYVPVATLVVRPQAAYSNERRALVDERMAFSPWNALDAHRPLGNIMRSRKSAYETSARLRMAGNAVCPFHARVAGDIPA